MVLREDPDVLMIKHSLLWCVCKIANDFKDKLLQTETCHRKALQKIAELESALQKACGELKVTLTQLQELQDALQKAQSSLEEKNIAIRDLTTELR